MRLKFLTLFLALFCVVNAFAQNNDTKIIFEGNEIFTVSGDDVVVEFKLHVAESNFVEVVQDIEQSEFYKSHSVNGNNVRVIFQKPIPHQGILDIVAILKNNNINKVVEAGEEKSLEDACKRGGAVYYPN